jgi:hypothetical protein
MMNKAHRPQSLHYEVLHGMGVFEVQWQGGPVTVRRSDGDSRSVHPTTEAWESFWATVQALNVWEWEGEHGTGGYGSFYTGGGSSWWLRMGSQDREITCSGDTFGSPPGHKEFEEALLRLIGSTSQPS